MADVLQIIVNVNWMISRDAVLTQTSLVIVIGLASHFKDILKLFQRRPRTNIFYQKERLRLSKEHLFAVLCAHNSGSRKLRLAYLSLKPSITLVDCKVIEIVWIIIFNLALHFICFEMNNLRNINLLLKELVHPLPC